MMCIIVAYVCAFRMKPQVPALKEFADSTRFNIYNATGQGTMSIYVYVHMFVCIGKRINYQFHRNRTVNMVCVCVCVCVRACVCVCVYVCVFVCERLCKLLLITTIPCNGRPQMLVVSLHFYTEMKCC